MMAERADSIQAQQIVAAAKKIEAEAVRVRLAVERGDHVEALYALDEIYMQVDQAKPDAVMRAHRWGSSWAVIGAALGITKQAAWERYRHLIAG